MNKTTKIIIAVAVVVVVVLLGGILIAKSSKSTSSLNISNAQDLTALVEKIYDNITVEMPLVETAEIETSEVDTVSMFTGLDSAKDIEYLVVSEPLMSSQAYSLVLVKVKEGADANSIAQTMNDNINMAKWVCVSAEKVYTTTSGDIICLVMSDEEKAKSVYDSFKTLAGSVGQEYEKTEEEIELPPEIILN